MQALSLMDFQEYANSPKTSYGAKQSPFFDPSFWNNDFEKRKEVRKKQLTINLKDIEFMDYAQLQDENKSDYNGWEYDDDEKMLAGLSSPKSQDRKNKKHRKKGTLANIDEDVSRQNTVSNHAKAVTKMRLKAFAKKEMFLSDIKDVFDPKYNKKWIKALCGDDKENVLHLVDDHSSSHQRKSTMAHWEHFDNQNVSRPSIKNGNENVSLVPKLIFFSKSFFATKEAIFIFRLVKQGIELLVNSEEDKVKMIEQLHMAFEQEFDRKNYFPPKYTQLQILEVCFFKNKKMIIVCIMGLVIFRNKFYGLVTLKIN